jgi:hypothetical protein
MAIWGSYNVLGTLIHVTKSVIFKKKSGSEGIKTQRAGKIELNRLDERLPNESPWNVII